MSKTYRGLALEYYANGAGCLCDAAHCFYGLDLPGFWAEPHGPYAFCPEHLKQVVREHHWAIRLRKLLLIPGSWTWNAWVRDATAWLERVA